MLAYFLLLQVIKFTRETYLLESEQEANEADAKRRAEQEVVDKITKKRNEILKPIIDKVNGAIQEVGKENGYAMIFDSSLYNFILSAEDSDDVTPLVKKKLGL